MCDLRADHLLLDHLVCFSLGDTIPIILRVPVVLFLGEVPREFSHILESDQSIYLIYESMPTDMCV